MPDNKRIVIVEDDVLIAGFFKTACEAMGHVVAGMARDAENACRTIAAEQPDFVLMDLRLIGDRDGVDVAKDAVKTTPDAKIVYITGSSEPESIARIKTDTPYRILIKPVSPSQLAEALH